MLPMLFAIRLCHLLTDTSSMSFVDPATGAYLTPVERSSRQWHVRRVTSVHRVVDAGHGLRPVTGRRNTLIIPVTITHV